MSEFKSNAELLDQADRLSTRIADVVNGLPQNKKDLVDKLEDLLKKQDSYTAAQIDSANCGRTSMDRRKEAIANIKFLEEYQNLLDLLITRVK